QRFGRLDAFCHCAAELGLLTRVTDIAPDRLERVFATNVFATQRLLRTLDPLFRASQSPSIVAVTDSAAIGKRAFWGHYAASKCAMEVLVRAYAAENEFRSLTVNLVDPGPMATRLRAEAYPGEAKDAQPAPETIADKILPLLAADAAQHEGTVGLRN
ncbi:MAG: SDR family oxidoreductase, partial [Pseudomonadota bacterium]